MSRALTIEQIAAVSGQTVRPAKFVYCDFLGGPVRVWSGIGDLAWGGNTYNGVHTFGGISEIEETDNPVANGVTLTLNGIPSELIALCMDRRQYRGRKVRIWDGFFVVENESATLIGTPIPTFAGRMDMMTPTDTGETSTIQLSCENRLIDLERSRERRRTDQDQRMSYPTDGSCRFIAGLQDKEFPWGQKSNTGVSSGGGGGWGIGSKAHIR